MFDLQVLKEWNDIETVLIDDFQETGNEQVLFVPHNFTISESKDLTIIIITADCRIYQIVFVAPFQHLFFLTFSAGEFSNFCLIDVGKGMISIEGSQVSLSINIIS